MSLPRTGAQRRLHRLASRSGNRTRPIRFSFSMPYTSANWIVNALLSVLCAIVRSWLCYSISLVPASNLNTQRITKSTKLPSGRSLWAWMMFYTQRGQFHYRPLQEDEEDIRLLVIYPTDTSRSSIVRCSLIHVSLAREPRPEYEAISYCWGPTKARTCIILDGLFFTVPVAADRVLRRMRDTSKERIVWIDAICINQYDYDERGSQVAIVGNVYRSTIRNLVYLDEDDDKMRNALRSVHIVYENMEDEVGQGLQHLRGHLRHPDRQFNFSTGTLGLPECDQKALQWLYCRRWFGRLWVLQEAALAPDNVCYSGTYTFPLIQVLRVAAWLHHKFHHLDHELAGCFGLANAVAMFAFVDKDHGGLGIDLTGKTRLYEVLDFTSRFGTSRPHDKIFALLGLLHYDQRFDFAKTSIQRPDYRRPVLNLFAEVSRLIIEQDEILDFFEFVRHRSSAELTNSGPSWVPRWHWERDKTWEALSLGLFFNASDNTIVQKIRAAGPPDSLCLAGFALGTVVDMADTMVQDDFRSPTRMLHLLQHIKDLVRKRGKAPESERSADLLNWVLIAGQNSQLQPAKDIDASAFRDFEGYVQKHGRFPPPSPEMFQHESNNVHRAARYYYAMRNACENRRVFVTTSGYVGTGTRLLEPGDILCILFGSRWPAILRPRNGGQYCLVGLCYVHGIMLGEFVRACRAKQQRYEVFTLI